MLDGGHASSLLQPAAFLIVVVGTLGAVLLQSGLRNFLQAIRMARLAFIPPADDHARLSRAFVFWSNSVRREGLLSLQLTFGTTVTLSAAIILIRMLRRGELRQEAAGAIPTGPHSHYPPPFPV